MLEVLLGSDGKRKMRLRRMTNAELFSLYEDQLPLRHRSTGALEEAKRVLRHFPPTPDLSNTPSEKIEQDSGLDSSEEHDGVQRVIEELKTITVNLGGTEFNGVLVIQKLWGKFELGMSRYEVVETLTKYFPSENPGNESGQRSVVDECKKQSIEQE